MRYRKLSASGDYVLGGGLSSFYVNNPDAVAQAVLTRLRLWLAEWYQDTSDGTNWQTGVLGTNTQASRDAVIRERVLGTPGVNSILTYSSSFDSNTRTFSVSMSLDTIYGVVPLMTVPGLPIGGFSVGAPTAT